MACLRSGSASPTRPSWRSSCSSRASRTSTVRRTSSRKRSEPIMTAAIRAEHVSKSYLVRRERRRTLKEQLLRQYGPRQRVEALKDVTFDVEPGQTYGIVGANGSGKSTLLKLIAGTAKPTSGTIAVQGRVSALLELGAGFHPDFTGRENVYLNASILGLSRKETDRVLPAIVDFAEL